MALPVGAIVKNTQGTFFIVGSGNTKRQFPDSGTLTALTLGFGAANAPVVADSILNALTTGATFPSLDAFVAANPRIKGLVWRAVRAIIPATGVKNLPGGLAAVVEAAANLFNDAIANPAAWANTIINAGRTNPIPPAASKAIAVAINALIAAALKQFGGVGLSQTQEDGLDTSVSDEAATFSDDKDDKDDTKEAGDKEDLKEAGEKDTEKEPGEKEPGEKEPGEKEPGEKEPGEKEPGEKEPGEKEPGEKEPGEKEAGEKDEKDGEEDGGGFQEDVAIREKAPARSSAVPTRKVREQARSPRTEWDSFAT